MKNLDEKNSPYLSIFVGIFTLAFILGCGSSYTTTRPVLDQKTLLKPDSGIVVARIINASSYPLPFNNLTITPENLNTSKKIKPNELRALQPLRKDTSIFASSVPIGNYSLNNINAWYIRGEYRYSFFVPASTKIGTFEVKAGHVTDLGTLVYYPKPQTDSYLKLILRVPESANGEVLKNYFPFYQYEPSKILSWKDDGLLEERESVFASVAQNPIIYNKTYLAPDGTLYFLSKLGIILTRTPHGEWIVDGVDTNFNLNAIAKSNNGDLIVGGAEGKLFVKPVGGEWKDISIEFGKEILELKFSSDSTIDMITNEKSKAVIYRTDLETLNWQELNAFSYSGGWKNFQSATTNGSNKASNGGNRSNKGKAYRIFAVNTHKLEDKHLIEVSTVRASHSGVFANTSEKTFSYNPETWEVRPSDSASDVDIVIQSGSVKIGIERAGYWDWDGLPEYFRYDATSNQWVEFKSQVYFCPGDEIISNKFCPNSDGKGKKIKAKRRQFRFNSLPQFSSELDAVALVSFAKFGYSDKNKERQIKLLKTSDGGQTWSDTGNELPLDYCGSFVREVTDRLLLSCEGASTDFYESFDNGANWEHVRQHDNF